MAGARMRLPRPSATAVHGSCGDSRVQGSETPLILPRCEFRRRGTPIPGVWGTRISADAGACAARGPSTRHRRAGRGGSRIRRTAASSGLEPVAARWSRSAHAPSFITAARSDGPPVAATPMRRRAGALKKTSEDLGPAASASATIVRLATGRGPVRSGRRSVRNGNRSARRGGRGPRGQSIARSGGKQCRESGVRRRTSAPCCRMRDSTSTISSGSISSERSR